MLKNPLNDRWESILEDCLTEHGFVTFRLTINRKTDVKCKGVILSVNIEGRKDREFKIGYLTMKTVGDSEEETKRDQVDRMFSTEAFVYNEVIKKFESMQSDLATSDKFTFPLCYKSTGEYVLMEDLSMKNFVVNEGSKILDFNHISLVMMELGRFHAFSIALKQRNQEDFDNIAKILKYDIFSYQVADSSSFDKILQRTLEAIDNDNLKMKLKNASSNVLEKVQDLVKRDNKYKVVCHGDLIKENMFFKYDENDEPSEVVMIDYQLSSISSPVTDIMCCLFTSGSVEMIREYEMVLDMYHDSLKLFLKKFQCLVNDYYHKDILKKDVIEYFPYVLARVLFAIDNMFSSQENNVTFKEKVNELVQTFSDLKFI